MKGDLKVAVCTGLFPPAFRGGGPIRSLSALVANAPAGVSTLVFTNDADLGSNQAMDVPRDQWVRFANAKVTYISSKSVRAALHALREMRDFQPDVVYLNSMFNFKFSILPLVLIKFGPLHGSQVVLAPRGEMGDAALSMKSRKKRLFLGLFKLLGLGRGVIWHASSDRELADIRGVHGKRIRSIVRENDTELPAVCGPVPPRDPGPLRAVNVARIVSIKGLKQLLESLNYVRVPLVLDVFGPEEDEVYAAACREVARGLPYHVEVNFLGELEHSEVRKTIRRYDVMIFPTRGENFGHIIAEALSVACPVVCADVTPWTPWLKKGAGVVVDAGSPQAWAEALTSYSSEGPDEFARRRSLAGMTYELWWQEAHANDHLFDLIEDCAR